MAARLSSAEHRLATWKVTEEASTELLSVVGRERPYDTTGGAKASVRPNNIGMKKVNILMAGIGFVVTGVSPDFAANKIGHLNARLCTESARLKVRAFVQTPGYQFYGE